jgi:hypothetical protein
MNRKSWEHRNMGTCVGRRWEHGPFKGKTGRRGLRARSLVVWCCCAAQSGGGGGNATSDRRAMSNEGEQRVTESQGALCFPLLSSSSSFTRYVSVPLLSRPIWFPVANLRGGSGRVVAYGTLSVYDLFACVCSLRSPFSYRTYRNNAEAGLQGV